MALLLIKNGANVNIPDNRQRSPLERAAQKGYEHIVNALIKHGANINAKDELGRTPLEASIDKSICYYNVLEKKQ